MYVSKEELTVSIALKVTAVLQFLYATQQAISKLFLNLVMKPLVVM